MLEVRIYAFISVISVTRTQLITLKQANNKQANNKHANTVEQKANNNNAVAQENKDGVAQENKHGVTQENKHGVTQENVTQENEAKVVFDQDVPDGFGTAVMQVEAFQRLVALAHKALNAGLFDDEDDEEVVKQREGVCMYLASVGAGWMPKK